MPEAPPSVGSTIMAQSVGRLLKDSHQLKYEVGEGARDSLKGSLYSWEGDGLAIYEFQGVHDLLRYVVHDTF